MGIQAASIFAAMTWITKQERSAGKNVVWLLEEPESYLHPSLSAACARLLQQLGADASVLRTTHSLSFVPNDPRFVRGAERVGDKTVIATYKTSFDAGASIRKSLGVKFSDYYGLTEANVFFEGPSDRELISWVLTKVPSADYPFLRKAQLQDFGGVKHLSGFLRATYALFVKRWRLFPCLMGTMLESRSARISSSISVRRRCNFGPMKSSCLFGIDLRSRAFFLTRGLSVFTAQNLVGSKLSQ